MYSPASGRPAVIGGTAHPSEGTLRLRTLKPRRAHEREGGLLLPTATFQRASGADNVVDRSRTYRIVSIYAQALLE